jgi:hypothetical protein
MSGIIFKFTKERKIAMESKLNHPAIEAYCNNYTKKILSDIYAEKEVVEGKDILQINGVSQINFFVLKLLFQKWKQETDKLQSPYFDYQNKEVKKALKSFLNTLSQHISIKKSQFEPLFKKAVYESILIVFAPYDFYRREINPSDKTRVKLSELQDTAKYIKVNKHLMEALIKKFQEEEKEEVFNDEALELLNEVCESIKILPEDVDGFMTQYSEVLPLRLDMIYGDKQVVEPVSPKAENVPVKPFIEESVTLNDQLQKEVKSTLDEIHSKAKNGSIKKSITINQRFMFVKELFGGNNDQFEKALDRIDEAKDFVEVSKLVKSEFVSTYQWNMESEEVTEFLELLERRFE